MDTGNSPKSIITRRLWLAFGLLILILGVTSIIYYWQIQRIDDDVALVIEIQEPLERAALQMQTNVNDTAQVISNYVVNRDPVDAQNARDLEVEFNTINAEFRRMANTDQLINLGQEIDGLHDQFKESADEVVALVDERHTVVLLFEDDVNDLSSFIDDMLVPLVGGTSPDSVTKVKAIIDMGSSLDEMSTAMNTYANSPDSSLSEQFQNAQADFEAAHTAYGGTSLSADEINSLNRIDEQFAEITVAGIEIIENTDDLQVLLVQFSQSFSTIDTYIEDEVQPLVRTLALGASYDVQSSVTSTGIWLLVLGIIGLVIGIISTWIISRNIAKPIRELVYGAKRISIGRLDHRFNVDARGEFGQLAFALNNMLDGLGRSRDALAESEESAWALLDATSDAVILIDKRGVIQASNELAATRFGMSLEQMIDESIYDILPANQAASMKAHVAQAVRVGKSVRYEDERESTIIDYNIFPIAGAKGETSRLAIFSRDITIRKWVEDVTDQLTRRNELILKAAGQGIYGLDIEGKATFVNPAAARMLGYEPEELTGERHHELVHHSRVDGKPYPNNECPVHATLKDGAVRTNVDDDVFWRKDGTYFPVEYTSTPIIEGSKIVGAVVTFTDITDRKRLEKMLRQSEGMYRSFFESSSSVIISIDKEGTIVDCNARIQKMLGYSPNEIIGQNLLHIVHPDEHTRVQEFLDNVLVKGFEYNNRFYLTRKDSPSIEVTMNAAVARDAKGAYVRTICMIDEITQQA